MKWTSIIAIYALFWVLSAFMILPFGVRSLHEEGGAPAGSDSGAPVRPLILVKALWTTAVSAVVFGLLLLYIEYA